MGFSRQEYWSGLPFSPPGDPPDLRIELVSPVSPELEADSSPLSHMESPITVYYLMPISHNKPGHVSRRKSLIFINLYVKHVMHLTHS